MRRGPKTTPWKRHRKCHWGILFPSPIEERGQHAFLAALSALSRVKLLSFSLVLSLSVSPFSPEVTTSAPNSEARDGEGGIILRGRERTIQVPSPGTSSLRTENNDVVEGRCCGRGRASFTPPFRPSARLVPSRAFPFLLPLRDTTTGTPFARGGEASAAAAFHQPRRNDNHRNHPHLLGRGDVAPC